MNNSRTVGALASAFFVQDATPRKTAATTSGRARADNSAATSPRRCSGLRHEGTSDRGFEGHRIAGGPVRLYLRPRRAKDGRAMNCDPAHCSGRGRTKGRRGIRGRRPVRRNFFFFFFVFGPTPRQVLGWEAGWRIPVPDRGPLTDKTNVSAAQRSRDLRKKKLMDLKPEGRSFAQGLNKELTLTSWNVSGLFLGGGSRG